MPAAWMALLKLPCPTRNTAPGAEYRVVKGVSHAVRQSHSSLTSCFLPSTYLLLARPATTLARSLQFTRAFAAKAVAAIKYGSADFTS